MYFWMIMEITSGQSVFIVGNYTFNFNPNKIVVFKSNN